MIRELSRSVEGPEMAADVNLGILDEGRALEASAANDDIDQINRAFYNRFPYPPPMAKLAYLTDRYFEIRMLNQSIGDWTDSRIPKHPRIWVAGCGSSQALAVALKFRSAKIVVGSDLSKKSLALCRKAADEVGITNLELREENLSDASYKNEFDYVVCTGVLHHMKDAQSTLNKLQRALKVNGVLELMIYNRYHRLASSEFQNALRVIMGDRVVENMDQRLEVAKKIVEDFAMDNIMGKLLKRYRDMDTTVFADTLLQPVENTYTIDQLRSMAEAANLELLYPRATQWDKARNATFWHVDFNDAELCEWFNRLSDQDRWSVANSLLMERSPHIWFFLQRKDSTRERKTEKKLCDEFLASRFERIEATQKNYVRASDGSYEPSPRDVKYPLIPSTRELTEIIERIDGVSTMREILQSLGIDDEFTSVNALRIYLTTSEFPYLSVIPSISVDQGKRANLCAKEKISDLVAQRIKRTVRRRIVLEQESEDLRVNVA